MLKSVIFDMDGVLVDSEPMHARANVLALKEFGLDMPYEYYLSFAGTTKYNMMSIIIREHGLDATPEMLCAAADRHNDIIFRKDGYTEIKGAAELVRSIRAAGLSLAVASSSPYRDINSVLDYFDIHNCFDVIISGFDEHIPPKPSGDIYMRALKLLDISADEAVAIEDTTVGIQAARNAGIRCMAYHNPASGIQDYSYAEAVIEDFGTVNIENGNLLIM